MDFFPDQTELKKITPKVTPKELVLRFFVQQQKSRFKDGWLYYKCKHEGLLDVFNTLQTDGIFSLLSNKQPSYSEPKLTIELVPRTCWFSNVRSNVLEQDWSKLKKNTAKKAQYRCEVCKGKGDKWPVECHEIWDYNDETLTQTLKGLIALCPNCHSTKHMGFTELCGRRIEITCHLAIINNWSYEFACKYIETQFEKWRERSKYKWCLDLSWLSNLGISINNQERIDKLYIKLSEHKHKYYTINRKKAADIFFLGVENEKQGNFAKAFEYYEESSNYGNVEATFNLAIFFFKGLHVPINLSMGWKYIEKGANMGDKKCMQWLEPEFKIVIEKKLIQETHQLKEATELNNKHLSKKTNSQRVVHLIAEFVKKLFFGSVK